jgi:hypothetical protein
VHESAVVIRVPERERRYREDPGGFMDEAAQTDVGPQGYGWECAAYFRGLRPRA